MAKAKTAKKPSPAQLAAREAAKKRLAQYRAARDMAKGAPSKGTLDKGGVPMLAPIAVKKLQGGKRERAATKSTRTATKPTRKPARKPDKIKRGRVTSEMVARQAYRPSSDRNIW